MEKVLDSNALDCLSYCDFLSAQSIANEAQMKFEQEMMRARKK